MAQLVLERLGVAGVLEPLQGTAVAQDVDRADVGRFWTQDRSNALRSTWWARHLVIWNIRSFRPICQL